MKNGFTSRRDAADYSQTQRYRAPAGRNQTQAQPYQRCRRGKKTHGKTVDIFHVIRGGAGQIALIGTPNCGKSSILAALTNAKVTMADFPFSTHVPIPGMAHYEDIQIQLVDMPPLTADFIAPGQINTYRNCDIIAIVVDLSADVLEQMEIVLKFLDSHDLLATDKQTATRFTKRRL